jgi:hypothetical protein
MEFDRIIESIYDEPRYVLKVDYKGKEYLYKEGDDIDEEIAEALFAEKKIRLRFIDTKINVVIFNSRNLLELDLNDPDIQRGLEEDGLHLETVDLLTRGLKGDAKDTWSDILESKKDIPDLEFPITFTCIRETTNTEGRKKISKSKNVKEFELRDNNGFIWYFWLPDDGNHYTFEYPVPPAYFTRISSDKFYKEVARDGIDEKGLKAVKLYEIKKGLKGDAVDTWSDILESKEHYHVVCTRGPYWLPDEQPDADEHFGYDCLINGNKIIIGEEPEDGFRYVYEADKKTYDLYTKGKKDIMPLIAKAIKLHEIKKGLKGSAPDTWEDILS